MNVTHRVVLNKLAFSGVFVITDTNVQKVTWDIASFIQQKLC